MKILAKYGIINSMNFNQLKYIVTIAKERNITSAAKKTVCVAIIIKPNRKKP